VEGRIQMSKQNLMSIQRKW